MNTGLSSLGPQWRCSADNSTRWSYSCGGNALATPAIFICVGLKPLRGILLKSREFLGVEPVVREFACQAGQQNAGLSAVLIAKRGDRKQQSGVRAQVVAFLGS